MTKLQVQVGTITSYMLLLAVSKAFLWTLCEPHANPFQTLQKPFSDVSETLYKHLSNQGHSCLYADTHVHTRESRKNNMNQYNK